MKKQTKMFMNLQKEKPSSHEYFICAFVAIFLSSYL